MKKTTTSKVKTTDPGKDKQKITSYFKKLVVTTTKPTKNDNITEKQRLTSPKLLTDKDDGTMTSDINIKTNPNKHKIETSRTVKSVISIKERNLKAVTLVQNENSDSDSDFVVEKKEHLLKTSSKPCKKAVKRDEKILTNVNEQKIKCNTDKTSYSKNEISSVDKSVELRVNIPETETKKNEKLSDITNSNLILSDNVKKRKFEEENLDIIPSTPQECSENTVKLKSKLCLQHKFPKIREKSNVDGILSPKKKNCISSSKIAIREIIINSNDKLLHSTINNDQNNESNTNFRISLQFSPIKNELLVQSSANINVSFVKSPPKSINSDLSTKSDMKIKRLLFNSENDVNDLKIQIKNTETDQKNEMKMYQENKENFEDIFNDDWNEEIKNSQEQIDQLNLENWQYCRILEIKRDTFQNLIIRIESIENRQETNCILQGVWKYLNLEPEEIINILAVKHLGDVPYCINNEEGFLVYEPDIMISPTSILGSQFCGRRGILTEKFRGFESESKAMIVGTLVHQLLQNILKKDIWKTELIEKELMNIVSSRQIIYTFYSSQITVEEIKKELLPFVPKIANFIEKYIKHNKNNASRFVKNDSENWQGNIHSIEDIEENIWCPQLGIKGKIDITIKTNNFESILPLELKTGRATMSLEHRGQVILYTMMMKELGYEVSSGLLLYLREDVLREVKATHREKRDLIMLRNEFAYYLKQKPKASDFQEVEGSANGNFLSELDPKKQLKFSKLPEPINHHNACAKCPYVHICTAILSRDDSYTLSENNPLMKLSSEVVKYLKPNHIDYFIHWTSLLTLESNYKSPLKELKDIWKLPPYQRESYGKSICYLKIAVRVTQEDNSFIHTFVRKTDKNITTILMEKRLKNDFLLSGLSAGNYVVISSDTRIAIATGFIKNISQNAVTVALERNLTERYENQTFHVDTYESQQIVNFSKTSLAALIEPTERAKRLRELIIDREPSIISKGLKKCIVIQSAAILRKLNKIQKRAVLMALTVQDYLLIKGMPGTGKTATIVALVQLLVKLNKTVLITSHTHSAVDNVCLRLLNNDVEFLRLGSENKIHSELRHRTESALTAHCKTVEELQQVYDNARVVAVTCLAASHPMLKQRKLDICIVDESTQVIQCSVLKSLLSTNSFILIGDPDQLPPVVKNPEAIRRGMNESLFERLDNLNSTITLTLQYRMNKIITDLANSVTYSGQLLCADENIESATLNLPNPEKLQSFCGEEQWILNILNCKLENSVIAVDTGPTWNMKGRESVTDGNLLSHLELAPQNVQEDEERKCSNRCEVAIVIKIVQALKEAGIPSNTIGIIAPYRAQVNLLRKLILTIYKEANSQPVEVNTVDQYQGRDKEVIIYSCTRSRNVLNPKNNSGYEILNDKRRLTVAITRSKHKLIIIGDFITLKEYSPLKKLLDSLQKHQKLKLENNLLGFNWQEVQNCIE